MCAFGKDDELEDEFEVRVRRQSDLIRKGKEETGQSFWTYVGLIGAVGWGIVLPIVLGVLLGFWIDRKLGGGSMWTLILLLVGVAIGCVNGWRTITEEHQEK